MTVSSDLNRISYAGNGTTTVFPVNYYFLENSHLQVILINSAGVETIQTLTTNYTVIGAGNQAGGSVTMLVAPPVNITIVIQRDVPATQDTDYLANDPFPAESHERALDKLTMLAQQNEREIGNVITAFARAIQIPKTETSNTTLPSVFVRAGKFLYFDNLGNVNVASLNAFEPSTIASFEFIGTGSQTIFALATSTFQNSVSITVGGVHQANTSYTIVGSTLTFSQAPPINSLIEIVVFSNI